MAGNKLGSETGSVINHLYSRMLINAPEPVVGMGCTILHWTDREACTVVCVDEKKGVIIVQEDHAKVIGDCYANNYEYSPNLNGAKTTIKRVKSGRAKGEWRVNGKTKDHAVIFGKREKYYDFSF